MQLFFAITQQAKAKMQESDIGIEFASEKVNK